jgi:hypothetical protein
MISLVLDCRRGKGGLALVKTKGRLGRGNFVKKKLRGNGLMSFNEGVGV